MSRLDDATLARAIADTALPLNDTTSDLDPVVDQIGDARFVLIGEASHGTHEFYRVRADLTRRLIREKGFDAVAAEADWPDADRVHRYVRGTSGDGDATEALGGFRRFPQWMWRNAVVLDFVGWLREHDDHLALRDRVGFYGLDLYSLHASIGAILEYLDRVDPEAARAARERYACFEHFGDDPQRYGQAAAFGITDDCEQEVVSQLVELQQRRAQLLRRDGLVAEDDQFAAEQNARVVANAEEYYRSMFHGRISTWNMRDTHMADTLDAVADHLRKRGRAAKIVVWAHNSHLGDARATELGEAGELNLGQLCRERHPDETALIGFSTYTGTVTAAFNWDQPAERKRVRPGLRGSYEALFHATGLPAFILPLGELGEVAGGLREARLQRAIGVIYRPQTERQSHYFRTELPRQFDVMIHIDETRALEPLERTPVWEQGELPETYPSGL